MINMSLTGSRVDLEVLQSEVLALLEDSRCQSVSALWCPGSCLIDIMDSSLLTCLCYLQSPKSETDSGSVSL